MIPYASGWLEYSFASPQTITQYTVTSQAYTGDGSWAPKTWTFEGYNGSTWEVLDTQTDITDWAASWGTKKTFPIANTTAYTDYRINVGAANYGSGLYYVSIGEMEMMSTELEVDLTTDWPVQGLLTVDLTTDWEVEHIYVTMDQATDWIVQGLLTVDLTTDLIVLGLLAMRDLATDWTVQVCLAVRDRAFDWAVRELLERDLATDWAIVETNLITMDQSFDWSVLALLTRDLATDWAVARKTVIVPDPVADILAEFNGIDLNDGTTTHVLPGVSLGAMPTEYDPVRGAFGEWQQNEVKQGWAKTAIGVAVQLTSTGALTAWILALKAACRAGGTLTWQWDSTDVLRTYVIGASSEPEVIEDNAYILQHRAELTLELLRWPA